MRILITGGTGLIGRALCRALSAANHHVTVLSRNPQSVAKKCGPGVSAIGDLADWRDSLHFDAVINLAGEPIIDKPWTEFRKKILWDSRVTLTRTLIDRISAAQRKPTVLLSGSAIGRYGDRGADQLNENSPAADDFAAQLCVAWEREAARAADCGLRVCLLRTGLVLSRDGGMLARMAPPFKVGLGTQLGNGDQWMSWIHIDDYVRAVVHLLQDNGATGPYNLTAPHPQTNRSFTAKLSKCLHRTARFAVPATILRLVLGSRAILLLGGQKVLPQRLEETDFQFRFPDLDEALKFEFADRS